MMTPQLHTSTAQPLGFSRMRSGAIYNGEPVMSQEINSLPSLNYEKKKLKVKQHFVNDALYIHTAYVEKKQAFLIG